jgi:hypothetical protein|tara:strand:- start:684 stop:911 length:228 start_codon:yes stop_codon:yes gene_type:complete
MKITLLNNLCLFVVTALAVMPIQAQLQVGDLSPNFSGPICMNGEDVNPDIVSGDDWSLYEEGYGKVTWINLFTSW